MEEKADWQVKLFGFSLESQLNLIYTAVVILSLWVLRLITFKITANRTDIIEARYQWRRGINYAVTVIAFLMISRTWFEAFQSLSTFFELVTAGIAIALKEPFVNLAG